MLQPKWTEQDIEAMLNNLESETDANKRLRVYQSQGFNGLHDSFDSQQQHEESTNHPWMIYKDRLLKQCVKDVTNFRENNRQLQFHAFIWLEILVYQCYNIQSIKNKHTNEMVMFDPIQTSTIEIAFLKVLGYNETTLIGNQKEQIYKLIHCMYCNIDNRFSFLSSNSSNNVDNELNVILQNAFWNNYLLDTSNCDKILTDITLDKSESNNQSQASRSSIPNLTSSSSETLEKCRENVHLWIIKYYSKELIEGNHIITFLENKLKCQISKKHLNKIEIVIWELLYKNIRYNIINKEKNEGKTDIVGSYHNLIRMLLERTKYSTTIQYVDEENENNNELENLSYKLYYINHILQFIVPPLSKLKNNIVISSEGQNGKLINNQHCFEKNSLNTVQMYLLKDNMICLKTCLGLIRSILEHAFEVSALWNHHLDSMNKFNDDEDVSAQDALLHTSAHHVFATIVDTLTKMNNNYNNDNNNGNNNDNNNNNDINSKAFEVITHFALFGVYNEDEECVLQDVSSSKNRKLGANYWPLVFKRSFSSTLCQYLFENTSQTSKLHSKQCHQQSNPHQFFFTEIKVWPIIRKKVNIQCLKLAFNASNKYEMTEKGSNNYNNKATSSTETMTLCIGSIILITCFIQTSSLFEHSEIIEGSFETLNILEFSPLRKYLNSCIISTTTTTTTLKKKDEDKTINRNEKSTTDEIKMDKYDLSKLLTLFYRLKKKGGKKQVKFNHHHSFKEVQDNGMLLEDNCLNKNQDEGHENKRIKLNLIDHTVDTLNSHKTIFSSNQVLQEDENNETVGRSQGNHDEIMNKNIKESSVITTKEHNLFKKKDTIISTNESTKNHSSSIVDMNHDSNISNNSTMYTPISAQRSMIKNAINLTDPCLRKDENITKLEVEDEVKMDIQQLNEQGEILTPDKTIVNGFFNGVNTNVNINNNGNISDNEILKNKNEILQRVTEFQELLLIQQTHIKEARKEIFETEKEMKEFVFKSNNKIKIISESIDNAEANIHKLENDMKEDILDNL